MTDAAWDVRPLQPGSRPGDRGSHIIEPTWTPGRFTPPIRKEPEVMLRYPVMAEFTAQVSQPLRDGTERPERAAAAWPQLGVPA